VAASAVAGENQKLREEASLLRAATLCSVCLSKHTPAPVGEVSRVPPDTKVWPEIPPPPTVEIPDPVMMPTPDPLHVIDIASHTAALIPTATQILAATMGMPSAFQTSPTISLDASAEAVPNVYATRERIDETAI